MIGFIIGITLGTILGFTACALLTVDKVKPRLPDHRSTIVRCKECKSYNGHRFCLYFHEPVLDNDFCSYGEKKEDPDQ